MLALALATILTAQSAPQAATEQALAACRPRLAEKAAGEISEVRVDASSAHAGWTVIRGTVRALIGMGEPAPGSASTHHLIRADYHFICWTHDKKVRKVQLNPVP